MFNFLPSFTDLIMYFLCMVGSYFFCQNYVMDILKLCDKLFEDSDLQDIPIDYIFRVVRAVFTAMASGDCFYKDDFD